MPPRIGSTTFVAFGDSITLGQDGNSLAGERSGARGFVHRFEALLPRVILIGQEYPTVLKQLLAARYPTQTILVSNEGFGGELAKDALARFVDVLGGNNGLRLRPEVILIMEGTNDIRDGDLTAIGPAVGGLRNMIIAAKVRNVRPYLATVPPMNPAGHRGARGWNAVAPLNDRIRALAAEQGVTLVDVHQAFNGNLALLEIDGQHPNAEGFATIARAFFDAIVATLDITPSLGARPRRTHAAGS